MKNILLWFLVFLPQIAPAGECQSYVGHMDSKPIEACLNLSESAVSGSYEYFKYRKPIPVAGTLEAKDGKVSLSEFGDAKDSKKVTGNWEGAKDTKSGILSGTAKFNNKQISWELFPSGSLSPKFEHHSEKINDCTEGFEAWVPYEMTREWDEVSGIPQKALMELVNQKSRALRPAGRDGEYKKNNCEDKKIAEDANPYSDDSQVKMRMRGKYLLEVDFMSSGYSGGAHPYEGGMLELYDLRTGKPIQLTDLFTSRGNQILLAHIKKEVESEDCNVNLNSAWDFDLDQKKVGITFGTYAFGCTGRSGYNLEAPSKLIQGELNPVYFDPATHEFY